MRRVWTIASVLGALLCWKWITTNRPTIQSWRRKLRQASSVLIYVSGPYSANTDDDIMGNVRWAMGAASHIFKLGHEPFIPHLFHFFDEWVKNAQSRYHPTYEDYMRVDLALVPRCDGFLLLGRSPGAMRELALAKEVGIPIWTDPLEIPPAGAG